MILTTNEAGTKFCPLTDSVETCATDNCMAWRWHTTKESAPGGGYRNVDLPKDKRTGYCGLAGKP